MFLIDELPTPAQAANIARRHRDEMMAKFAETGDRKFLSSAMVAQECLRAAGRRQADEALAGYGARNA